MIAEDSTVQLAPSMTTLPVAAPELMKDLICMCPVGGCHVNCVCTDNEQPCTAECGCACEGQEVADCNNYFTWHNTTIHLDVDIEVT